MALRSVARTKPQLNRECPTFTLPGGGGTYDFGPGHRDGDGPASIYQWNSAANQLEPKATISSRPTLKVGRHTSWAISSGRTLRCRSR